MPNPTDKISLKDKTFAFVVADHSMLDSIHEFVHSEVKKLTNRSYFYADTMNHAYFERLIDFQGIILVVDTETDAIAAIGGLDYPEGADNPYPYLQDYKGGCRDKSITRCDLTDENADRSNGSEITIKLQAQTSDIMLDNSSVLASILEDDYSPEDIALVDITIVASDYRGYGLQRQLITRLERQMRDAHILFSAATIHPDNQFSLNNALACGYEIVIKKEDYYGEGFPRYLLLKKI